MTLSWDIFTIAFFIALGSAGAILGKGKSLGLLMGSFMGYVVATELGTIVFDFAKGYAHSESFSLFMVKAALFFLTIIILNAKTELSGKSDETSPIISIVFGLLAAGFIGTALLSFMDPSEKASFLQNSQLIVKVDQLKLVWIVAPIGVLFFADFVKGRLSR